MINLAEKSIVAVLNQAMTLFRANLSFFVPDIYAMETDANQQAIMTWWSNPNNQVVAQVGYTKGPVQGLQFAVTMGQESQVANRRFIGNVQMTNEANQTFSTTFQTSYVIGVLGPNQNWLLWAQAFVKWALLYYTLDLETDYNLFDQLISLGPLQPYPDSMGDSVFPFMRTVTLTAQHEDSWTKLPAQTIATTELSFTDTTS